MKHFTKFAALFSFILLLLNHTATFAGQEPIFRYSVKNLSSTPIETFHCKLNNDDNTKFNKRLPAGSVPEHYIPEQDLSEYCKDNENKPVRGYCKVENEEGTKYNEKIMPTNMTCKKISKHCALHIEIGENLKQTLTYTCPHPLIAISQGKRIFRPLK